MKNKKDKLKEFVLKHIINIVSITFLSITLLSVAVTFHLTKQYYTTNYSINSTTSTNLTQRFICIGNCTYISK